MNIAVFSSWSLLSQDLIKVSACGDLGCLRARLDLISPHHNSPAVVEHMVVGSSELIGCRGEKGGRRVGACWGAGLGRVPALRTSFLVVQQSCEIAPCHQISSRKWRVSISKGELSNPKVSPILLANYRRKQVNRANWRELLSNLLPKEWVSQYGHFLLKIKTNSYIHT